jgi:uncharacterized membrane protein (UPF0127 family)
MSMLLIIFLFIARDDGKEIIVSALIAESKVELKNGLMHIKNRLPRDHGMLFDFGNIRKHRIWMKNTHIPLDIIFLDMDYNVIGFIKNAKPLSEDLLMINKESRYVLEMNGGWSERINLKKGDHITIKKII